MNLDDEKFNKMMLIAVVLSVSILFSAYMISEGSIEKNREIIQECNQKINECNAQILKCMKEGKISIFDENETKR